MIDETTLVGAIAQHARWKHFLRQAVDTGQSEWTVATVRREDQCEFGRWLAQVPPVDKQGEHWVKVNQLHAAFHVAAAEVLQLALAGHQAEARENLMISGHFTKVSSELVVAISDWKKTIPGPR